MADLVKEIRERLELQELIIKGSDDGVPRPLAEADQWRAALDEMVERHGSFDFPPDEDDGPGDYAWTAHCEHCGKPWPCPDLAGIARRLGIEVPDA